MPVNLPFTAFGRICIGMEYARLEMAVLGARIVRDYEWTALPGQDLSIVVLPTPRPKSGLLVKFQKRKTAA